MQTTPLEDIIKIQPKGLITIPIKYRKKLGLEPNKFARMKITRGSLVIEPVHILPYPVRSYTDVELEEFLALDVEQGRELRRRNIIK